MNRPTFDLLEMRQAIDALSATDVVRLGRVGRAFALGLSCDGDDLVSEAICQSLDGSRNCPKDVPILVFLVGVMRSRASAARDSQKGSPVSFTLDATGTDGQPLHDPPSLARNAEDWCLAKEEVAARIAALEKLLDGDDEATLFLWADLDETPKEEIIAMNNLDDSSYATIRRRMRRKINGRFPLGWPS